MEHKSLMMLIPLLIWVNMNGICCSKILALLPTPSPSHHYWNRALMLALAERGHQVTVFSPDPEKEPVVNYSEIIIEGAYQYIDFETDQLNNETEIGRIVSVFEWGQESCKYGMSTEGARKLMSLKGNVTFDLIIVEAMLEECFLAFIPIFGNPPFIAITAFGDPPWAYDMVGNPINPSWTSTYMLPYTHPMTFNQRLINFILHVFTIYYRRFYHLPYMDSIVHKYLGDNIPPVSEIEKNTSLVMVNTHFSIDQQQPLVPAMIPIGGMHIKQGELEKNLKKYLDEAQHGIIFFSFGTNIRSDRMDKEKVKLFLDAFSELPQKIIWKWESSLLPDHPKNVMMKRWLPQNDILAHSNVVLFITHCGRLSIQESVYHGVPILGMPFMADQFLNLQKIVNCGLGEKLPYEALSKDSILKAIHAIIGTPRYMDNAKRYSNIFKDQLNTPLDRAVYWTEYVIKHKGASHLKAASVNLPWIQHLHLDTISFLLLCYMLILLLFYQMYKIITSVRNEEKSKIQ